MNWPPYETVSYLRSIIDFLHDPIYEEDFPTDDRIGRVGCAGVCEDCEYRKECWEEDYK